LVDLFEFLLYFLFHFGEQQHFLCERIGDAQIRPDRRSVWLNEHIIEQIENVPCCPDADGFPLALDLRELPQSPVRSPKPEREISGWTCPGFVDILSLEGRSP